jgi:hypothetical protein
MTIFEKCTEQKVHASVLSVTFVRNIIRYDKRFANLQICAEVHFMFWYEVLFYFCAILAKIVFHQHTLVKLTNFNNSMVFWDVTPYSSARVRRFEETSLSSGSKSKPSKKPAEQQAESSQQFTSC